MPTLFLGRQVDATQGLPHFLAAIESEERLAIDHWRAVVGIQQTGLHPHWLQLRQLQHMQSDVIARRKQDPATA